MALNPFFLQGNKQEQLLVQDLTNEHIRMFGVEFIYMPRVYVKTADVLREVTSSKFDRSFPIEGFISSYEGFDQNYNLLTKFGVRSTAEMKIIISQDRYDSSIAPLLWKFPTATYGPTGRTEDQVRPYEGDLMYFPMRDIIFEIKYVNDIVDFYQLRNTYTYELTCEPFEYTDETFDTRVAEIDDDFETEGYNVTMILGSGGEKATVFTTLTNGGIYKVDVITGGVGFNTTPTVRFDAPVGAGHTAQGYAKMVRVGTRNFSSWGVQSVVITDPGSGYIAVSDVPNITFVAGDGVGGGAEAIAGVGTEGVVGVTSISYAGKNYSNAPSVTVGASSTDGSTTNATAFAGINSAGQVTHVHYTNAGYGYTSVPVITIGDSVEGSGTFNYGDVIKGSSSLTTAFVSSWDASTNTLLARNLSGQFSGGETITVEVGVSTGASYTLNSIDYDDDDAFNDSETIEYISDTSIVDFTEQNPFGEI